VGQAVAGARYAANATDAMVFAPTIATFSNANGAAEADLANGVDLAVELDSGDTARAHERLEGLLGRALMISDVPVNVTNGRPWAALPSRPVVIDGQHVVDAQGKFRWNAIVEWASDSARYRFSDSVVGAVLDAFPSALDDAP